MVQYALVRFGDTDMSPATMTRVDELRSFADRGHRLDEKNDAEFRAFMREACLMLEMSEADVADVLSVSRPTYNRWINGRSIPHPLMRRSAISRILDRVTAKIKAYSGQSRSGSSYSGSRGGMVAKPHGS